MADEIDGMIGALYQSIVVNRVQSQEGTTFDLPCQSTLCSNAPMVFSSR